MNVFITFNHHSMSEKMTPSGNPYTWPKHALEEDLTTLAARINALGMSEVAAGLGRYENISPWKSASVNTFEMMALYQQAMTLLGKNTEVDTRFWPETYISLKVIQKGMLWFTGNDIDGLPGPKTTVALIEALNKKNAAPRSVPTVSRAPRLVTTPAIAAPATLSSAKTTLITTPAVITTPNDNAAESSIFSYERNIVNSMIEELTNPRAKKLESTNWTILYIWENPIKARMALIPQKDGEYYLWWSPVANTGNREIYRLNKFKVIIGAIMMTPSGTITWEKWQSMKEVKYIPWIDFNNRS